MSENQDQQPKPRHQNLWYAGCAAASASIIMGAMGGHKYHWSESTKHLFVQGIQYSLTSSIGIMLSAHYCKTPYPAYSLLAGILLFCAPIWYKCFTEKRAYQQLMPIGGVFMILGWALMALF